MERSEGELVQTSFSKGEWIDKKSFSGSLKCISIRGKREFEQKMREKSGVMI